MVDASVVDGRQYDASLRLRRVAAHQAFVIGVAADQGDSGELRCQAQCVGYVGFSNRVAFRLLIFRPPGGMRALVLERRQHIGLFVVQL